MGKVNLIFKTKKRHQENQSPPKEERSSDITKDVFFAKRTNVPSKSMVGPDVFSIDIVPSFQKGDEFVGFRGSVPFGTPLP